MGNIFNMIVIVYLIAAMIMDLKLRRVKNWWIIIGYALSILISFLYQKDILSFLLGFIFPFPLLIFYRYQMIGAGDIKLLSVLGCLLGIEKIIHCIIPIVIISAIITILSCSIELFKGQSIKAHKIPMVVAIAIGVIMKLVGG